MDNFKTCERLLKSFWDHIDCNPEEAHPVGYRVVASAKWIGSHFVLHHAFGELDSPLLIDNEKHYFAQRQEYDWTRWEGNRTHHQTSTEIGIQKTVLSKLVLRDSPL